MRGRSAVGVVVCVVGLATTIASAQPGFLPGIELAEPVGVRDPFLIDMDADGDLDLVTHSPATAEVRVRLNEGSGSGVGALGPVNTFSTALGAGREARLMVMDIGNDGLPDAVVAGEDASGNGRLITLMNSGTGGLSPVQARTGRSGVIGIASGDSDGDGNLDVVVGDGFGVVSVHRGDGTGVFSRSDVVLGFGAGQTLSGVAIAELTGDGLPDLLAVRSGTMLQRGLVVRANDGSGAFAGGVLESGAFEAAGVARTLGGPASDVLVTGPGPRVQRFINDGTGRLPSVTTLETGFAGGASVIDSALVDVNADNLADLVAVSARGGDGASVRLGQVGGGFGPAQLFGAPSGAFGSGIATGDLNGDLSLDLVATFGCASAGACSEGRVVVWLNRQGSAGAPAEFLLVSPDQGARGLALPDEIGWSSGRPRFEWTRAEAFGPVTYLVQVSRDEGFTDLVVSESVANQTSFAVPAGALDRQTRYWWRVIAFGLTQARVSTPQSSSFTTSCPAELGAPSTILNFTDIGAFLQSFSAGCP